MGHAQLVVIGGGNMGRAIVQGAVRARLFSRKEVVVAEPDEEARRSLLDHARVEMTPAAALAFESCGPEARIVLAVKPQVFPEVAKEIASRSLAKGRIVASVMAGVPTKRIVEALGGDCRVVRVMPNLPLAVQRGMSAFCLAAGAGEEAREFARGLFGAMGEVIEVEETLMDAFTAVAGSGPAYVFYLAQAMIEGAVQAGFTREQADRIVRQTIRGAATLLASSDPAAMRSVPVEEMRKKVSSKGGTTSAAMDVLDARQVSNAVSAAILAARDRGRELSR